MTESLNVVKFFKPSDEFGWLSNHNMKYPFKLDGIEWRSVHQYFLAGRFPNSYPMRARIAETKNAIEASKYVAHVLKDKHKLKHDSRIDKISGIRYYLTIDEEKRFSGELKDILTDGSSDFWRAVYPNLNELLSLMRTNRLAPIKGVKNGRTIIQMIGKYIPDKIDINRIWEVAMSIKDLDVLDKPTDFTKFIRGLDDHRKILTRVDAIRKKNRGKKLEDIDPRDRADLERADSGDNYALSDFEESRLKELYKLMVRVAHLNKEIEQINNDRSNIYALQENPVVGWDQWNKVEINKNGDKIRVNQEAVMKKGMKAKFDQNIELRKKIRRLNGQFIYDNKKDSYWGIGDGDGLNRIGYLIGQIKQSYKLDKVEYNTKILSSLPLYEWDEPAQESIKNWLRLRLYDLLRTLIIYKDYVVRIRNEEVVDPSMLAEGGMKKHKKLYVNILRDVSRMPIVSGNDIREIITKLYGCKMFANEVGNPNNPDLVPDIDPETLEDQDERKNINGQWFIIEDRGRSKVWVDKFYSQVSDWILHWENASKKIDHHPGVENAQTLRFTDYSIKLLYSYVVNLGANILSIALGNAKNNQTFQRILQALANDDKSICPNTLVAFNLDVFGGNKTKCFINALMNVIITIMDLNKGNFISVAKVRAAVNIILLKDEFIAGEEFVNPKMVVDKEKIVPVTVNDDIKNYEYSIKLFGSHQKIEQQLGIANAIIDKNNLNTDRITQLLTDLDEDVIDNTTLPYIALWLNYVNNSNFDEAIDRRIFFFSRNQQRFNDNVNDWSP